MRPARDVQMLIANPKTMQISDASKPRSQHGRVNSGQALAEPYINQCRVNSNTLSLVLELTARLNTLGSRELSTIWYHRMDLVMG